MRTLLYPSSFSDYRSVEEDMREEYAAALDTGLFQVILFPNLTCTLNIFVRVLCYDLISFGFSCPYHTDCIS